MAYDWTKHVKDSTLEGRAVEGGGGSVPPSGGTPAVQITRQPKGFLKFNTAVSFVIDSLSYLTDDEREAVLDLIVFIYELDMDVPLLTQYNRRSVMYYLTVAQRNSEAAPDGEDE